MNPAPELAPQLKQLRLSGIFESLEARNRQAIEARMAYTDFLALLISDEVAQREQKKFSTRPRRAQFRTTKTLEQFDFERLLQLNRALVHDLAAGRYVREKAPVLIVGTCGTGKSHPAQALGHCAVRQGVDVVFHHLHQPDAEPERRLRHRELRAQVGDAGQGAVADHR
jgi:DNA replication protein DnaC